ncbi:transposase family protein [Corynebacterium glucuronolyticum]|nr:transposase family protein [Corynebacterium glucuronolyticum]
MHVPPVEALQDRCFICDHGSVYTSDEFKKTCSDLGVTQSMGSVGTSADNAFAESFNSTLKREVLQDRKTFANQCRFGVGGRLCPRCW